MPNYDNNVFEKLSALVDGESVSSESGKSSNADEIDSLLGQVRGDERCWQAWHAYHLTRDVIQKDYHPAISANFAARLSASIDDEETFSAPTAGDSSVVAFGSRSASQPSAQVSALARSNRRWKSVAALGMAASVALASAAALQLFNSSQESTTGGPEIARLAPGSSTVEPLTLAGGVVPAVLTGGGTHWRDSGQQGHAQKVEQQLNSYLTSHLEDAAMGKVSGMISHTRVVGYDSSVLRSESF